jgi:hypothetical protein
MLLTRLPDYSNISAFNSNIVVDNLCSCRPNLLQAADMMKSMSPEQVAAFSRQAGHTMSPSDVADAQRQMAAMPPEQIEAMAKLAAMGPQARESPAAMVQAAEVQQLRCTQQGIGGGHMC